MTERPVYEWDRAEVEDALAEALAALDEARAQLAALREAAGPCVEAFDDITVSRAECLSRSASLRAALSDTAAAAEAYRREVRAEALEEAAALCEARGEATRHPSQMGPQPWNPSGTVLTDAGAAWCDAARQIRALAEKERAR